ncbi:hypothetical protein HMPREF0183_0771 [Brevibacterium mcbrellneri ATCC 49030]|uniref:Uncharacterized protein n=1 Tax=Brevibacterium mcbrellneri ATCC 49030 TaxID=585530 RepID=D4YLG1_9MICO|nr:hypothetical protein HMPREF0183_0771 [Brevibacterium mcbrellneri ATCC 49030]
MRMTFPAPGIVSAPPLRHRWSYSVNDGGPIGFGAVKTEHEFAGIVPDRFIFPLFAFKDGLFGFRRFFGAERGMLIGVEKGRPAIDAARAEVDRSSTCMVGAG